MELLMCNVRRHLFSILVYYLDISPFPTVQALFLVLMIILENHAVVCTHIYLLIAHTEGFGQPLALIHVLRQLMRLRKSIPDQLHKVIETLVREEFSSWTRWQ